jgi:cob(I)alamin adenosyltransferase
MKIYTKTGDNGKTGLIGGTRVSKYDIRLEAYGTIDELNSNIGFLASFELKPETSEFLETIQHNLFVIGSYLATDNTKIAINKESVLSENAIFLIENQIDRIQAELPELREFILPGGNSEAGACHIARTIARRAERRIVEMSEVYMIDNQILTYVNRLSDYLFVLSRQLNIEKGVKEILWKK